MQTLLNALNQPVIGKLERHKSVFIGAACAVSCQAEALEFVASRKHADPKARHVCYCAIWNAHAADDNFDSNSLNEQMSDDGEPSGTAGKPILEVLHQNNMVNCVITVTRYFGGILLGSGGLIRAYSTAASLALKAATMAEIVPARRLLIQVNYARYERLQQLIRHVGAKVNNESFTDQVNLEIEVAVQQVPAFTESLTNLFNGQVCAQEVGFATMLNPL
jgi:uncharacterized YigZ family protein